MRLSPLALVLTAAAFATHARAVDVAPPNAEIKTASRAGNGCPAAPDAKAELSKDLSTLKVEVPQQIAEIAGRGGATFARVNCDVVVTITHTAGWQVTPVQAKVGVIAHLAEGANGDVTVKAYQQGDHETASTTVPLNAGDTRLHAEHLKLTETWSPCSSDATVIEATALKLRGGDGPSKLGAHPDELQLKWRRCQ